MKTIALAVTLFLALPLVAQSKHFETAMFSADFPENLEVTVKSDEVGTPVGRATVTKYFMLASDGAYLVGYTAYPANTTYDYDTGIKGIVKAGCDSANGDVASGLRQDEASISGYPGRAFEYWCTSTDGSRLWHISRLSWHANQLWQVAYVSDEDSRRVRVNTFFDSVVIKR